MWRGGRYAHLPYGLSATKVVLAYARGHGGRLNLWFLHDLGGYERHALYMAAHTLTKRGLFERVRLGVYMVTS